MYSMYYTMYCTIAFVTCVFIWRKRVDTHACIGCTSQPHQHCWLVTNRIWIIVCNMQNVWPTLYVIVNIHAHVYRNVGTHVQLSPYHNMYGQAWCTKPTIETIPRHIHDINKQTESASSLYVIMMYSSCMLSMWILQSLMRFSKRVSVSIQQACVCFHTLGCTCQICFESIFMCAHLRYTFLIVCFKSSDVSW